MIHRVLAIVLKELAHLRASRRELTIILLMPVFQLLVLGYAINTVADHLPTVVFDSSQDAQSRALVAALDNSGFFDVISYAASYDDAVASLDRNQARVALIVDPSFGRDVSTGQTGQAQLLVDGSDPSIAQAALFAGEAVARQQAAQLAGERAERFGRHLTPAPLELRPVLLYNPAMLSVAFLIPGLIGLILQQQALTLTSLTIARERELGTLEQLTVTPVRPLELMVGKCLPYASIALISVAFTLVAARVIFGVEIAGSTLLLFAFAVLYLVGSMGMGLLISTISRTQTQARQLSELMILPSIMLTGFVFPRESMPVLVQQLSLLLPLTYFLQVLRGIMLKDVGLDVLWPHLLPLAVYAAVAFAASALWLKKWPDG